MPSSSSSRDRTANKGEAPATTAIPEGAATTQRLTKRNRTSSEGEPGDGSDQKRRRRAFSCISCRKLKCRCEYEPGTQGCHRCQTLRIECSLRVERRVPISLNSTAEQPGASIEERLQRHDDSLKDIQLLIAELKSQRQPESRSPTGGQGSVNLNNGHGPEADEQSNGRTYLSRPADSGTNSAPIVVLREINAQVYKGYRRLFKYANLDLVELRLIDEDVAKDLVELFSHYQGHNLIACNVEALSRSGGRREASAFLHSVCCLLGIVYRKDLCGTPLHRQIYEQVRLMLGQALLSSPLTLDEINAVFLMSNNPNTPSNQGSEYIDSWLLTGYCAKQSMLSISFSKIVSRIKQRTTTVDDQRAIRLFSLICLHHLQWAATTGRPSTIPAAYINQCNLLLEFYQATIQDAVLVAEVVLYSNLHQKLSSHSYLGDGGDCDDFTSWRQEWNHLWALPTSSMLKVGYYAACLILSLRCLEENGGALQPKTFLSDEEPETGSEDARACAGTRHDRCAKDSVTRAHACKHARLVLETFLDMPPFLMDSVPTCLCLCIGYCALVLAHYDESRSKIPDPVSLSLITRIDDWVRNAPGKAWSFKYGELARRNVEARIRKARRAGDNEGGRSEHGAPGAGNRTVPQGDPSVPDLPMRDEGPPSPSGLADAGLYSPDEWISPGHPFHSATVAPSYEQALFPSLECYFGGGIYDFTR